MTYAIPLDTPQLAFDFDAPAGAPPPHKGVRRVALGHESIDYRLRRARRRSIGFMIDDGGLTVSAPRWVRLADIDAAVIEKRRWIRDKIAQWHACRRERGLHRVHWGDGGCVPYLGTTIALRCAGAGGTRLHDADNGRELRVALAAAAEPAQWRDAVHAWLQAQARTMLGERLTQLARNCRQQPSGWALSFARTQWGSCTHDGRIRLNWRLIHFALPVIDYVVAHELAHLAEMNHSARFWKTVGELLPGFEIARDEIRNVDLAALIV